jgi:hypothetical protein
MKAIAITTLLVLGVAAACFGAGDPMSSVKKESFQETTTFTRDGKRILEVSHSHLPERGLEILRQEVILNDKVVMVVVEWRGQCVFSVLPNSTGLVSLQQDSSKGTLETIVLWDASKRFAEAFEVKSSRLTPVSGEKFELFRRALTWDLKLLAPKSVKKSTPALHEGDRTAIPPSSGK